MKKAIDLTNLSTEIDDLASQCVKCGLCLPHCPTYQLTENENESPRGRIALMQAVANGQLPFSESVNTHLDQCLACRTCERVCPAHVKYGELITKGRTLIHESDHLKHQYQPKTPFKARMLSTIAAQPLLTKLMGRSLQLIEISGFRKLSRTIGLTRLLGFKALDQLLPKVPSQKPFLSHYPAKGAAKGKVALFKGCISSWSDRQTLEASIHVLNSIGFDVIMPKNQGCCGAMALHHGDHGQSQTLALKNLDIFPEDIEAIISPISGCGATLKEYDKYLGANMPGQTAEQAFQFSQKVIDISDFILKNWDGTLKLKPIQERIAYHHPCTLKNVFKSETQVEKLLALLPKRESIPLTQTENCCGSAGTYMLTYPENANQLAEKMLSSLEDTTVDTLVTSNIGCGMHLAQQLKGKNAKIRVIHPITCVAEALGF